MNNFESYVDCWLSLLRAAAQTPQYGYQVIHAYPHDPNAFTEGLEYRAGFLYESTGLKGRSWLRKEKLETGQVLQQIDLDPQYFGEGITVINQQIVRLTWQSNIGFVYNQASFGLLRTFNYPGEGWALTNDGQNIYMDDGTRRFASGIHSRSRKNGASRFTIMANRSPM